jgi:hypothetical protein
MHRARLKGRIMGGKESLPELAQSIKKLTRWEYPTADQAVANKLALENFVDALTDPDMRLREILKKQKHWSYGFKRIKSLMLSVVIKSIISKLIILQVY